LYASPNIIRVIISKRMRWVRHVADIGEMRNRYKILVGKPEGKRPLGRRRHRWEDNIRMDLRELGWHSVEWMHLAQDRDQLRSFVDAVMNVHVAYKEIGMS
jgi:hypothetical protein